MQWIAALALLVLGLGLLMMTATRTAELAKEPEPMETTWTTDAGATHRVFTSREEAEKHLGDDFTVAGWAAYHEEKVAALGGPGYDATSDKGG